ncbi:hypothetical protein Tco_0821515 [Tanacetum coccineum]|uniref:Uncharacterized protein n=1 Tax=Tanacetum coccineum TaxID=301880 RepID=A0ABQ5AGN6_9ASTR
MAEVTNDAENHNFATGPTHTEQPEFNNEGKVDQNAEQCYDTCPLPAKLIDDKTIELLNQLLESENVCLKKTVAQSVQASVINVKWRLLKITLQAPPRSSMFKRRLIAADQASVFMEMTSVHISSGLVLHQMTSDQTFRNSGIQDHSMNIKFKIGSKKVVP